MREAFSGWTREQRSVVVAAYLGWTLDAFDFFVISFVFADIAKEFATDIPTVAYATFLTMAARFLGAFVFGRAADRYGRRPILMLNVALYSLFAFLSGFSPNLVTLLVLRALFGVAMGGEWGVGASLAMESIPSRARGAVSGILQTGYPTGYLLAALCYWLFYDAIGWRGMLMLGALPALLVLYIRRSVSESPGWEPRGDVLGSTIDIFRKHWKLSLYVVVLMTALNYFGHGTQDLYATFLRVQHGFDPATVGRIAAIAAVGGICGGLVFGTLSQRHGRRRMMGIAVLLVLPVLPLWAYSATPALLAAGAFAMQFLMQGAWGVVPAHLNELSPAEGRGTFPGVIFSLGNLLAAYNAPLQAQIAEANGGDYAFALALVVGAVVVLIALLTLLKFERRDATLGVS